MYPGHFVLQTVKIRRLSIYRQSIFSHNGATDRNWQIEKRYTWRVLASAAHCFHPLACTFFLFLTISLSFYFSLLFHLHVVSLILLLFFFLHLPSHSNHPLPCSFSLPLPSSPFSREALTTQSRFASYFQKPLKASHFRIFHSSATH